LSHAFFPQSADVINFSSLLSFKITLLITGLSLLETLTVYFDLLFVVRDFELHFVILTVVLLLHLLAPNNAISGFDV